MAEACEDKGQTALSGSHPKLPDESMLMTFDTPERLGKTEQKIGLLTPLIPCPETDPFDECEVAAAAEPDPFELVASNAEAPEPTVVPSTREAEVESKKLGNLLGECHSINNVVCRPTVPEFDSIAGPSTNDAAATLIKLENPSEGHQFEIENKDPTVPRSPQSPFSEIPSIVGISRALSGFDLTAACSRGPIASTPITTPTRFDIPRAFRAGPSAIPRRSILDNGSNGNVAEEFKFNDFVQQKIKFLEKIQHSLKRPSIRPSMLKRAFSAADVTMIEDQEENDYLNQANFSYDSSDPDLDGVLPGPLVLSHCQEGCWPDRVLLGEDNPLAPFLLVSTVGDELPDEVIGPDELHKEAHKLANIFKSLGAFDNLIEDDIRLEIPLWEEDKSLAALLDEIDEFGLPEVLTFPDVSFISKLDTSQEEIDSLLRRYKAQRNSIHKDNNTTWDESTSGSEKESKPAYENNAAKIVDIQGLANAPIIQPPPIPENSKIEVRSKSAVATKSGPMKATVSFPSLLKAGASKTKTKIEKWVNSPSSSSRRSQSPSPKKVPTVPAPLTRSNTTGAVNFKGSLLRNTSSLRSHLRAPDAANSQSGSGRTSIRPKSSAAVDSFPGGKSSKGPGRGVLAPVASQQPKPASTVGPPKAALSSKSSSSKGVLAPVTAQPPRPSTGPKRKKFIPHVPGKENR